MLNWLRRKQQPVPTWRVWYAIPIKSATPPEWVEWLGQQQKGIEGEFFLRQDAPRWIFDGTMGGEEVLSLLKGCGGIAAIAAHYEEHPKPERRGQAYLDILKLAHSFAQREVGVAINLLAYRFYHSAEWKSRLDEFRLEDHYTTHMVYEENEHGTQWLHTHGLVQFDIPEVEIKEVPPEYVEHGNRFIGMMARFLFSGERFADGHTLGASEEHPDVWAICKSIKAAENEGHGEPEYPLLRFSDYDQETGEVKAGIVRYLEAMGDDPLGEADNS